MEHNNEGKVMKDGDRHCKAVLIRFSAPFVRLLAFHPRTMLLLFCTTSQAQLVEWVGGGLAIMQYTLWAVSGSSQQQRLQAKMASASAERKWPTRMAAEKPLTVRQGIA